MTNRAHEDAEKAIEPVLCYVNGDWAYFTTCPLDKQWGDDWNDAPYEHNAGSPYEWREYMGERGIAPYRIEHVAFTCDLDTPSSWVKNSSFSVEDINGGREAWLYGGKYSKTKVKIFAGTPLSMFIALIEQSGGKVYLVHGRASLSPDANALAASGEAQRERE